MNPDEANLPGVEFVDAAATIAKSLPTGASDEVMAAAAVNYSNLGLLDDAIKSAEEISDSYLRDTTITQIAGNTVSHDPDADVLSLVDSIDDPGNQNLALEEIAVKYAEQKLFDQALETSERLEDRDSALARIVSIIAKEDSLDWANELVREIVDLDTRVNCLIELATIARSKDRPEEAGNFLAAAEGEAEAEVDKLSALYQVLWLIAIADVYEELGDREKAQEILARALKLSDELDAEGVVTDLGKSWEKDEAKIQLTVAFARWHQFDQAERTTQQIEHPIEFARASTYHAIQQSKAGHDTQGLQMLSEARDLITSETVYGDRMLQIRDEACGKLALAYGTLKDFKNGLSAAQLVSDPAYQFMTLIELGKQAALAGLSESVDNIQGALIHDYARAVYLISIADALLQDGNKELAVRLLFRANEHADKLRHDQRCLLLIQISFGLAACDLESKANELLSEVLQTTVKLEDNHQQAQILIALAEKYQKHARSVSAVEKQLLEELPT